MRYAWHIVWSIDWGRKNESSSTYQHYIAGASSFRMSHNVLLLLKVDLGRPWYTLKIIGKGRRRCSRA